MSEKKKETVRSVKELLQFIDEYDWDEKEKPYIRGIKSAVGANFKFVHMCDNSNCHFYFRGFCDCRDSKGCREAIVVDENSGISQKFAKLGFQNNDIPLPHIFRCVLKDLKKQIELNNELKRENISLKKHLDEMTELYENVLTEN